MSGPDSAPPNDPGREASDTLFPPDHAVTSLFGRGAVDWPATEQGDELFPAKAAPASPPTPEPPVDFELPTRVPEPGPDPVAEPAAVAEPEPNPEPVAVVEPAPEPVAVVELEREPEPVAGAEPEPEPDPSPEPAAIAPQPGTIVAEPDLVEVEAEAQPEPLPTRVLAERQPEPEPELARVRAGRVAVDPDPGSPAREGIDPLPEPDLDFLLEFPDDPPEPDPRAGRFLPTFPALDGVKGLAIAAVVLYDAGMSWAKGGGLGISTLFTLVGFLAIAGLLAERGARDSIDVRDFWRRRVRHALGPALVAMALAAAFGLAAAVGSQRDALAGDGISSLLSVANWRFILDHQPFGPAGGLASPMRQFWALSVIGQLLIVVPIALVVVLGPLRWARSRFAWLLGAGIVVSILLSLALAHSPARVLYGTDTRAAELLAGCLLAVVIYDPWVTIRLAVPGPVREWINGLGVAAGVVLVGFWIAVSATGHLVLHGGLAIVAVLSTLVVVAAILPEGPISWALSRAPLRWLGRIAIALYLVHWPIFVWIDPRRSGLSTYPLLAVRLVVALVAAVALQWAAERLARREARAPTSRRTLVGLAVGATALVVVLLIAVSITAPSVQTVVADGTGSAQAETPTTPPTVAFYGDALAVGLETAAKSWADETGQITVIPGVTSSTCGLDHGGTRRLVFLDDVIPPECDTVATKWQSAIQAGAPDVAVVVTGISELSDHQQPTDGTWIRPGDPAYDTQLSTLMTQAMATLAAQGSKVIWVNLPSFTADSGPRANADRVNRFNQLISQVAAGSGGLMTVADLSSWAPTQASGVVSPSSAGFTPTEAQLILHGFLGDQLTQAATSPVAAGSDPSTTTAVTAVGG